MPDHPTLRILNPATQEVLRELETDSPATLRHKVRLARYAQRAWAEHRLEERVETVRRFGELLELRRDYLAALLTAEVGKPIRQSHAELTGMQGRVAFFVENAARALADELVMHDGLTEERIRYEPLGVVANISAWNYPYFVGSNVFLPALLAGNAVLYKPSEHATLTGLAIAELLHEAGVPQEVFTPAIGAGRVGAALLDEAIDAVFFTGSYATGRSIAEAAAPRLLSVQLELGGKDPVYVCDDVDVGGAAAAVAEGAFYNAGQSCCAVERVYVQRGIAEAFTAAFVEAVRAFAVGDPTCEETYIGPVAREAQLEVLRRQVEDALGHGARLLCGGERRPGRGYFFEPTVLDRADHRMRLMREESFGPLIGIQAVPNDEEAVALMNDTEYGLTAGVFSGDRARAERILARVDAGSAYWNCCDRVSPRLPWSGRKHSGLGSTLSIAGIRALAQPKAWHLRAP